MSKLILSIAIIFSVTNLMGQSQETRDLSSFDAIDVSEAIEVILEEGNEEKAIVKTEGVDPDKVITEVRGGTLNIHMRRGNFRSLTVQVYVTYKRINSIDVNSAAVVTSKSTIKSDEFEIEVNSAGRADLDIDVKNLEVSANSAGKLELSGRCDFQRLEVDSAGKYYGYDLKSRTVQGNVNSAGKAEVTVSQELRVNADSGGKLTYRGDPEKVIAEADSGGRIRKAE